MKRWLLLDIRWSHCTQNCIFYTYWRLKTLTLRQKVVQNLLIFVYLFCPKGRAIDSRITCLTKEWLVVESCVLPHWIAFLMLYWLVYNIRSHFNELILTWSAYFRGKTFLLLPWTLGWSLCKIPRIPRIILVPRKFQERNKNTSDEVKNILDDLGIRLGKKIF